MTGLFDRVARWCAYLAAALILAMSGWITIDVVGRNCCGFSAPWAFDLSEYSLVWITFLAAPWVLLRDRHVRIEILVERLPVSGQRILGIAVCVAAAIACAVFTWRTSVAAYDYAQREIMMPRIWRIPRIWPYIVVPVGGGLLLLALLARLHLYLRHPDPEGELKRRANAELTDSTVSAPINYQ